MKINKKHVLIAIILSTIFYNIVYLVLNKNPQIWDSAAHINLAMMYAQKMQLHKFSDLLTLSGYYPPFIHFLGALFYMCVPVHNSPLILTQVFNLIWIIFLYKFGGIFLKNEEDKLIYIILILLLPQVYIESRLFQLDLPLTLLITMSLYYLHTSEGLTKFKESILFFLLISLAHLTKWYAFMYLLVPFIYEFTKKKRRLEIKTWAIGVITASILVLPWYYLNYKTILSFFSSVSSAGELNDPQGVISVENITEYINLMISYQSSLPITIMVVVGILLLKKKRVKEYTYPIWAIIVPYVLFTFLHNKDIRYIMPLVIYVPLVILNFYNETKSRKKIKTTLLTAAIIFLTGNMLFISFNNYKQATPLIKAYSYVYYSPWAKYKWMEEKPNDFSYNKGTWEIDKLYYLIKKETGKDNTNILLAVDLPYFNVINFNTLQIENSTGYKVTAGYNILDTSLNEDTLKDYDWIVVSRIPTEKNLSTYDEMENVYKLMTQKYKALRFSFEKKINLPNNEEVLIYKKKAGLD